MLRRSRALAMISWRLARFEWRGFALAFICLMVPCAVGTIAVTAGAAGFAPIPSTAGDATHRLFLRADQNRTLNELIDDTQQFFGKTEVTLVSKPERLPGTRSELTFESIPQIKVFGGRPITVFRGKLPVTRNEIAVSVGVLDTLRKIGSPTTDIGDHVVIGTMPTILVGIVQDPADFETDLAIRGAGSVTAGSVTVGSVTAGFVTAGFVTAGFVTAGSVTAPDLATVLVKRSNDDVQSFIRSRGGSYERFADNERQRDLTVGIIFGLGLFVLLFVAVLSSVSFTVLAARHAREYGVLHAVGATGRDVRIVVMLTALVVGLCAATIGFALGLACTLALRPALVSLVGHEIVSWSISPWLYFPVPFLTVAAAIGASLRPALLVSRTSPRSLLGGSIVSLAVRRSSERIACACGLGVAVLLIALSRNQSNVLAAITPVVALVGFMAGSLVWMKALLKGVVRRGPLVELVGRDAARNSRRTRSAIAALAAIATIPASLVVLTSADERRVSFLPDNLPTNVALLLSESMAFEGKANASPSNLARLDEAKQRVIERLPGAETAEVFVAVKGQLQSDLEPIRISRPIQGRKAAFSEETAWVETQSLRAFFGLPEGLSQSEALSNSASTLAIDGWDLQRDNSLVPESVAIPQNLSIASTWLSQRVVTARNWDTVRVGVLVRTNAPIDNAMARTLYGAVAGDAVLEVLINEKPDRSSRNRVVLGAILLGWLVTGVVMALVREESRTMTKQLHQIGATKTHIMRFDVLAAVFLVSVALMGAVLVAYVAWFSVRLRVPMPFVVPIQLAWLVIGMLGGAASTGFVRRKRL